MRVKVFYAKLYLAQIFVRKLKKSYLIQIFSFKSKDANQTRLLDGTGRNALTNDAYDSDKKAYQRTMS